MDGVYIGLTARTYSLRQRGMQTDGRMDRHVGRQTDRHIDLYTDWQGGCKHIHFERYTRKRLDNLPSSRTKRTLSRANSHCLKFDFFCRASRMGGSTIGLSTVHRLRRRQRRINTVITTVPPIRATDTPITIPLLLPDDNLVLSVNSFDGAGGLVPRALVIEASD